MKRSFLHWFYLGVQFVMLAVSIPKVAMLFHAYDTETLGPLIGGVDLRSWLVGVAIDLTATFTTWAAMAKYEETRKRTALLAPGLIILFCTALSVVANYEDAATQHPEQYAHVALFMQPALLINPVLISAPPILVLLLILLVPSVLARVRVKTAAEIEAEADEAEALINAEARVKEAKARANAKVRSARVSGLADTVNVITKRADSAPTGAAEAEPVHTPEPVESLPDPSLSGVLALPSARVSKAMWASMPLSERVVKSGLISAQEVAEVLGVSAAHARKLLKEARTEGEETRTVTGRTGVPYQPLIDALYARKTSDGLVQAQKLEKALGLRKRTRQPILTLTLEPESEERNEEVG